MIMGLTASTFDLLHAGHIAMLREAKTQCDYLICALQVDPSVDRPEKNKPIQSYEERNEMINSIKWVDQVVYYDTEKDLYQLLEKLPIDVRIIGADWKGKKYTGHDLDIQIVFNSRDHGYSTSDLRKRVYEAELKKRNS